MCQFEYLHVQTSCMYIDGASKLAVAKARGQRSYVLYHVIYIQGGIQKINIRGAYLSFLVPPPSLSLLLPPPFQLWMKIAKGFTVQWQRPLVGVFKSWVPHLYVPRASLRVFISK